MGMDEERRGQKLVVRRLAAMGLEVELLPGGRSAVARLPLRPAPFPTAEGPRYHTEVRFATVGTRLAKCLEPLPLFHLPLVAIDGCTSAEALEDRIRAAWAAHGEAVRDNARRLGELGVALRWEADGTLPAVGLGADDPEAAARLLDGERVALPSRGPLGGLRLARAADRVFFAAAGLESAVDFEIAVTTRLEELAREARRTQQRRRAARAHDDAAVRTAVLPPNRRILLVGSLLGGDRELPGALRRCGFEPVLARGADEVLELFATRTFDVVLTDARLGRLEGLDLVPRLHALPGVTRLPVVVVDDRARPARREAARRIGAAGYLTHPVDVGRIAAGLARMAGGHRGRRFQRFARRLAVRFEGEEEPASFTTALSRLGMFVRTERPSAPRSVESCTLAVPETGALLRVEAQALYRVEPVGMREAGIGLRFRSFPDGDEAAWLAYLEALAADPAAS
jgi:two-component system, cell cycle response regulator DivK